MKVKMIFCKHDYKKIAKKESTYCRDYLTFTDGGDYIDVLYKCEKCGKEKIETFHKKFEPAIDDEWHYYKNKENE